VSAVVVVGSVNVDHLLIVDRLPRRGETVLASEVQRRHGGKGANQAVAAVRTGARAWIAACVGDDPDGAKSVRHLAEQGVEVGAVRRDGSRPTGTAFVIVSRAESDNQIVVAPGANDLLGRAEVLAAMEHAQEPPMRRDHRRPAVLVSFEVPDEAVVAAGDAARRHGARLVVNPAPFRPLPAALDPTAGVLTPNEQEASELLGLPASEPLDPGRLMDAFRRHCPGWGALVATLGAAGAAIVEAGSCTLVPAPPVEVVDTTGAGDVFNGVLAARLSRGDDLRAATTLAVEAASASTRYEGAQRPPEPAQTTAD
jgi:ribokinase